MTRLDHRALDELRPFTIKTGVNAFAEGSVLVECGKTVVYITASVEDRTPPHVAEGHGWVTAEYSMLPRALAAASMGGNTPVGGFLVSLLFGIAQAFANIMQLKALMSYEIVLMVPYVTTLIGLGVYYYAQKKRKERLSGR